MRATEIAHIINAEIITGKDLADNLDIGTACGSDLMSDVIAFVKERVALLTGLTNPQVLRTADLMDIRLIIFVRGKKPSEEMIQMAREQGIVLMRTHDSMFVACGKLYQAGIKGDSSY
jgi:predicted transcriptional regulator